MQTRNLKLTHDEIALIQLSLSYLYGRKLDLLAKNQKIISEDERKSILENANKYDDLRAAIEDGKRDI